MLKEFTVKGKRQLSFVVKEGVAADIVIPLDYLQPIDYRRLVKMEEAGGELMKVMRDTKLDNGKDAIIQFQELFVTVLKERVGKIKQHADANTLVETEAESSVKRGRGRPKGSKNKS